MNCIDNFYNIDYEYIDQINLFSIYLFEKYCKLFFILEFKRKIVGL